MIRVFNILICAFSFSAVMASSVLYCLISFPSRSKLSEEAFNNTFIQLKPCKIGSVLFVLLSWFLSSGATMQECLTNYASLSKICFIVGITWLVFLLITIILGLILIFIKRGKAEENAMKQQKIIRNSAIPQSIIFLIIAFLLNLE